MATRTIRVVRLQAVTCLLLVLPKLSVAGDWQLSRGINLSLTEVQRNQQNLGNINYQVVGVQPHFILSGAGSHITGNVRYAPTLNIRQGYGSGTYIAHQLDAFAHAELYPNTVFLDASANARLGQNANTAAPVDLTSGPASRVQIFTTTLSPRLREHLGTFANLVSNNQFSYVSAGSLQSARTSLLNIGLLSGSRFSRLGWALNLDNYRVYYPTGTFARNSVKSRLSYQMTRTWQVSGGVGYVDTNDPTILYSHRSATWQLGSTWSPNPRTTLSGDVGHSYYGYNWHASFDHVSRHTRVSASWSRILTNSIALLAQTPLGLLDASGQPLTNPYTGQPLLPSTSTVVPGYENFVQTSSALTVAVTGLRTVVAGTVSYTTRDFDVSAVKTTQSTAGVSVTRELSGRTSADANLSYNRIGSSLVSNAYSNGDAVEAQLGLNTQLGRRSVLSVYYAHVRYHSDTFYSYDENRIGVTLGYSFD